MAGLTKPTYPKFDPLPSPLKTHTVRKGSLEPVLVASLDPCLFGSGVYLPWGLNRVEMERTSREGQRGSMALERIKPWIPG